MRGMIAHEGTWAGDAIQPERKGKRDVPKAMEGHVLACEALKQGVGSKDDTPNERFP
jgi:hypothetical protein